MRKLLRTVLRPRVSAAVLAIFLVGTAAFSEPASRSYSLSVQLEYGSQPSRRSFLEDMQRKVEAWVRASGDLHAAVEQGAADLHLLVTVHEVDRGRAYPQRRAERDVFVDMPTSAITPYVYHTRFELHVAVVDIKNSDHVVVQDDFTIYNETRETALNPDPEQRSWEDNLQFMVDRLQRFLSRRDGKIRRYLRSNPRPDPVSPEPR